MNELYEGHFEDNLHDTKGQIQDQYHVDGDFHIRDQDQYDPTWIVLHIAHMLIGKDEEYHASLEQCLLIVDYNFNFQDTTVA